MPPRRITPILVQEPEDDGERTETDDGERTETDDEKKEAACGDNKVKVKAYQRKVWVKAHCRSKKKSTKKRKKAASKKKKKPAPVKGISDAELKARMDANAKRQQSRMDNIINKIESGQGIWSNSSAAAQWEV